MTRTTGRRVWWAALGLVLLLAAGAGGIYWTGRLRAPDPLTLGRDAYEHGDWKAADVHARAVLATRKDDRDALRLLARASARLGRDDMARRLYQRLGVDTMEPEDNLLIALALLREGRTTDARDALQIVLQDQRNHPEARRELAKLSLDDNRPVDAMTLVEPLANSPAGDPLAEILLGLAHDRAHDPAGSIAPFENALRRDPLLKGSDRTPAEVRKLLARSFLKLGKPAEARSQLKIVLDDAPDPEASWLLSRAALQAQDQAAASAALAAAGDYGADHPEAWEPAPYVGAAACVECHASIHRTQQSSRHSQTFRRVPERPALPLPSKPVPDPKDPRVIHELTRTGDRIDATTKISDRSMHDTIAFIMGSGDRAFTLVGRDDDGTFREHRLSYYGRASRWDVTTGHNPHPDNPLEFLGQPQNRDAIHSCLNCHTTDFRATFEQVGPAAADHAIGCERCHGPAGNHLAAVASAFPDQAIGRPRLATSEAVVQLCGQCHGAGKRELPRNDPAFLLRFQATTLPMSKCYTKSGGNLSCITCHSPHRNAETSPAFYEAKCLACHRAEAPTEAKAATVVASHATPTLSDDARRVACPVSPAKGCISCHMPTSMGPMPHSTFTDHQIRVHRDRPAPGSK